MSTNTLPPPGRHDAIELGCTCPVADNNQGEGVTLNGKQLYWFNESCPLHQPKDSEG